MRFKRLNTIFKNFGHLWPALRKFNDDNGLFLSSGISFYILINLIPFIMLLSSLVGTYLYNDREVLNHIRAYFRDLAPALDPKIMKDLTDIVRHRQLLGISGFLGLLWIATWVFGSLRIALNIVFRAEKNREMLRGKVVDLLMVLLVGILFLVSMILSPVIIFLPRYHGLLPVAIGPTIQWILRYLLPFFLTYCMFVLIYKIIPNKRVHIKSALQAALFTSLIWELSKHLFAWYVLNLARHSLFYGSLSTLAIFFFWVYYSSAIFVVGGEFAYFLEEDRQKSST